jgi:hypothetical protein
MNIGVSLIISDDITGGECTSIGTWNITTKTCTLNTDLPIGNTITIYNSGITLNGNGHTMSGITNGPNGVVIYSNITVKNLKMIGFSISIDSLMPGSFGNNRIINNTFYNAWWALRMYTTNNLIENNTIESAYIGMVLFEANQVIRNNNIINCYGGVSLASYSNVVYNNNFINNGVDISGGGNNIFNLSKPVGGNYYDRFDTPAEGCYDIYPADGFCDTSYGQDQLPWTKQDGWLDSIPPATTIAPSGTLGNDGWYTSDVLVTLTAADNEGGSGVKNTEYSLDNVVWSVYTGPFTLDTDGEKTVYCRSTDTMGNVETTKSQDLKIDKTNPIITGAATTSPNAYGWYNGDVTVHFDCTDTMSLVSTITPDAVIAGEGAGQSSTGICTDKAGNTADVVVGSINIDKTIPIITITTPTATNYLLNQNVLAGWSTSDALSGIDTTVGTTPSGNPIDTSAFGPKTFKVTATDKAGNTNEATVTYNIRYNCGGILQPIEADGTSIFKLGSTVPVKFQLWDSNNNYVRTAIAKISVAKLTNAVLGDEVEAVLTSAATAGNLFRYDTASEQYIFNLGTKALSKGTWQIKIVLDDGTPKTVRISLR